MKERKLLLKSIISVFLIFVLLLVSYNCFIYLQCFSISRKIMVPVEQEYIRFKIYGSSYTENGPTVSGTVSVVDSNGNDIALIERSWTGLYLAVEFAQCNFLGTNYIFPNKIYGKESIIDTRTDIKQGTSLEKYYNENGQCMLLGYGSEFKERHALYNLARFATRKIKLFDFGTTSSFIIDLSECKTEVYYSIKRDEFGKIFIEEI